MSKDLAQILHDWPYDPEGSMVRLIQGDDGKDRIQLRIDLGVLQMELEGRPDGARPNGFESWLEHYEQKQREHDSSDTNPYLLSNEDCARLWREGVQYYHRYLSCWHLDMFDLCARDTKRNLRLFAFVRAHSQDDAQKMQFDQWRPYVTMMHARAVATPLVQRKQYEEGLQVIEAGIDAIHEFLDEYQQSDRAAECAELVSLERWREEIVGREQRAAAARPKTAVQILRQQLEAAVAAEEFEEAARLRDEIRRMSSAE
jgi:hypothetical protein